MKKIVTIGGKTYVVKDVEGSAPELEEVETGEEVATEVDTTDDEKVDEKIEDVAEKIVASLGISKIQKQLDDLTAALSEKTASEKAPKKVSALLNLEELMKKDVSEMTSREKIIGFFQGMVQSNHAVLKALSEGNAADGGYLFPDEFRSEIIRDMAEVAKMRNLVTVVPMRRDVMNMPTLESRPSVTWTQENAAKSTTTAHFNQATLTVKKMAAILYASDELIDDSTEVDVVNFIIGLFSEAIGMEEDRVIWRGNGTTEPTGIVTAQNAGAIAGLTCGSDLSADRLIDLSYELPQKYHPNAKYYAHRSNLREMRKFKDTNGRYLWTDSLVAGQPPQFNGYPVIEVNELSEAQIYFGDLKKAYWIGDRQRMTVKISQDTETAFTHDQTAIRVVSRIAGNVILGAACKALVAIP